MSYINDYKKLQNAFSSKASSIELDNIQISKFKFSSEAYNILPGHNDYCCPKHQLTFKNRPMFHNNIGSIDENIFMKDDMVEENKNFEYHILYPKSIEKITKVVFLFHGFNEKHWDKYLVWGKYIAENTQSAVVFFPIAFHMQRAPMIWSEKKNMFKISANRRKKYPNIINSTLANVAISIRLHSMPQRFFWSGLQTYYDIIQLIENIKSGTHPIIDKDFSFNIFYQLNYVIVSLKARPKKSLRHAVQSYTYCDIGKS